MVDTSIWFKEVWSNGRQFMIERYVADDLYILNVFFYLGDERIYFQWEYDTKDDRDMDFEGFIATDCEALYEKYISKLN